MDFKLIAFLLSFLIYGTTTLKAQTKDTISFEDAKKTYLKKDYETAMQQFLQLKERYIKEENQFMLGKTLKGIGVLFKKNKNYGKAKEYFFKALQINHSGQEKLSNYLNLASLNYQESYLDSSLYYYTTILKDSSLTSYKKQIANTHKNLSGVYILQKKTNLAQNHINIALKYYKKYGQSKDLISLYNNAASIYMIEYNYKKAKEEYQKIYTLFDHSTDIYHRSAITDNLKTCFYYLGDMKMTKKYDSLSDILQDSIYALEFNEKITEIEAIHNKDKARAEEAIKTEKQRKAKERTQYILTITGLITLLIILFGTVLYRNNKLKTKNLSLSLVTQKLEQQQKISTLQKQNQSQVLNATLDGRETERKDIAQTLHDSVSALLSSANMHLQVVKKKSTVAIDELEKSQRIIDEASEKVRDLSHKLISAVLLKFGLEHAVYDMCEKYSNSVLEFELESEDKIPRFEQNYEIKLHNIIEECINNIIKHSKANEASIKLLLTNEILAVTITDDGVGFDTSTINPKSGIGLSQIIARVENLNGEFIINSVINKGTEIIFKVPVAYS